MLAFIYRYIINIKVIFDFLEKIDLVDVSDNGYETKVKMKRVLAQDTEVILKNIDLILMYILPDKTEFKISIFVWINKLEEYTLYSNFVFDNENVSKSIYNKLVSLMEIYKNLGIDYSTDTELRISIIWLMDEAGFWKKRMNDLELFLRKEVFFKFLFKNLVRNIYLLFK